MPSCSVGFRVAKQIYKVLVDFLGKNDLRAMRVLDVGCSSGAISYYLSSFVKSLVALDIDVAALRIARKNYKKRNLNYLRANGLNLPFPDASFDLVICNEVYSYLPDSEKLMDEVYRVLKPGGSCYFSGGNWLFPIESRYHIPFLHNLPDSIASQLYWFLTHKRYYVAHYKTYWELKELLGKFSLTDYTAWIVKNPYKFSFIKLYRLANVSKQLPLPAIGLLVPFLPTFIFMLRKPDC